MGAEPFLLSSSLIGVLAQRLVRVLDPALREAYPASARELAAFGRSPDEHATLYRPGANARGKNAGYSGRTGIYELIAVDEAGASNLSWGNLHRSTIHFRASGPISYQNQTDECA
jgi:general secretion pathway protein E